MATVTKGRRKKKVIDREKLLARLKEILSCQDEEVIKMALRALVEEIEDHT